MTVPARVVAQPVPSFDAIYEQHARFVWRVLLRLGVAPSHVADATQDVFLVVHRRYRDLYGESFVRSWLFGITRRVAQQAIRAARRDQLGAPAPVPSTVQPPPDEVVQLHEAAQLAQVLLASIPHARREVFILAELEGLTGPEIAAALGVKENTVYSRLRRARREFERALARRRAATAARTETRKAPDETP